MLSNKIDLTVLSNHSRVFLAPTHATQRQRETEEEKKEKELERVLSEKMKKLYQRGSAVQEFKNAVRQINK